MLRASDGGTDATALLCASPVLGVFVTLAAIALAWGCGFAVARLLNFKWGLLCAGLVVAWAAWQSGRAEPIIRRVQSTSSLWTLAIEAAIYGVLGVIMARSITGASDPRLARLGNDDGVRRDSAAALLTGILAGGITAFAVARSSMVGQTFAAATAAGVLGTLVGRVVGHRAVVWASVAAGAVLSVAGPVIAAMMHGAELTSVMLRGDLFPLARVMPLDWLAGTLIGTAVGVSWAGSMVEKHAPHGAQAAGKPGA